MVQMKHTLNKIFCLFCELTPSTEPPCELTSHFSPANSLFCELTVLSHHFFSFFHSCKTGIFVYECKTCNRAFPSFQALGGHRASHKKTKVDEKKSSPTATTLLSNDDHENLDSIKINTTSPPRTSVNSLLDGMDIVGILESQETSRTDCPLKPCRIVNCGELPLRELIYVFAVNIPLPIMAALLPLNLHLSSTMKIAVL